MSKERSDEIQKALKNIYEILNENQIEISEHAGGLCLFDKKESEMFLLEYCVIPAKSTSMSILFRVGNKNEK